jgi:hypothetical protein
MSVSFKEKFNLVDAWIYACSQKQGRDCAGGERNYEEISLWPDGRKKEVGRTI